MKTSLCCFCLYDIYVLFFWRLLQETTLFSQLVYGSHLGLSTSPLFPAWRPGVTNYPHLPETEGVWGSGLLALKPEKSQTTWDELVTLTLPQTWPIRANCTPSTAGLGSVMGICPCPKAKKTQS